MPTMGILESRFADIIWTNEPMPSGHQTDEHGTEWRDLFQRDSHQA